MGQYWNRPTWAAGSFPSLTQRWIVWGVRPSSFAARWVGRASGSSAQRRASHCRKRWQFSGVGRKAGSGLGLGLGGITTPMCELLERGLIKKLVDTQDFDLGAIESIKKNPNHYEISTSEYANPMNKGAYVNKLDFVILASLEVDVHFNCNVVVGSDGMISGAQGDHPDTAAGAKCTIVIVPLLQGRIPAVCTDVTTVTTPGETVDVVITDYGIAINPRRQDLIECMKDVDLPFKTIEELRDMAYAMAGEPDPVQFEDRIVGVIEARDGTVIDVVRQRKEFEF